VTVCCKRKTAQAINANTVHICTLAGPCHALTQGHMVMKCAASMDMHVDMTVLGFRLNKC